MTIDSGFGEPFNPEDVEAEMARLHSLEDNGEPIILPNDPNAPDLSEHTEHTEHSEQPPTELPPQPEPAQEAQEAQEPSTPSAEEDQLINFGGRDIPMSELRGLVQFNDWLTANPDVAQRISTALDPEYELVHRNQQPTPPPAPPVQSQQPPPIQLQPPNLPEDFDYEDPANRYLVDNINSLRESQLKMNTYLVEQQNKVNQGLIQQGINRFRENNAALTDSDVQQIISESSRYGTIDTLVGRGMDIPTATVQALDYAMWSMPAMRDALYKSRQEILEAQAEQDRNRQSKLTALSGGNGSTGRATPPPPQPETGPPNLRGIPNQMVEDIRGYLGQNAG